MYVWGGWGLGVLLAGNTPPKQFPCRLRSINILFPPCPYLLPPHLALLSPSVPYCPYDITKLTTYLCVYPIATPRYLLHIFIIILWSTPFYMIPKQGMVLWCFTTPHNYPPTASPICPTQATPYIDVIHSTSPPPIHPCLVPWCHNCPVNNPYVPSSNPFN